MRIRNISGSFALVVLGLVPILLWPDSQVGAQVVVSEREQSKIGSVVIGRNEISVIISYQADSALLTIAVPNGGLGVGYIPLVVSTFRGMNSLRLDLLSPESDDEIWVKMSAPRSEMLAYYNFGSKTAITQFGDIELLTTSYPEQLSGGPIPFPLERQAQARPRASFYIYD